MLFKPSTESDVNIGSVFENIFIFKCIQCALLCSYNYLLVFSIILVYAIRNCDRFNDPLFVNQWLMFLAKMILEKLYKKIQYN